MCEHLNDSECIEQAVLQWLQGDGSDVENEDTGTIEFKKPNIVEQKRDTERGLSGIECGRDDVLHVPFVLERRWRVNQIRWFVLD